jgi:hypothetical protein
VRVCCAVQPVQVDTPPASNITLAASDYRSFLFNRYL